MNTIVVEPAHIRAALERRISGRMLGKPVEVLSFPQGRLGLTGAAIPGAWTRPWSGRIGLSLAGSAEVELDDVVARTVAGAEQIAGEQHDQP